MTAMISQITPLLPAGPTGPESLSPLVHQGKAKKNGPEEPQRRLQAVMEVEAIFLEQLLEQMRRALVDPISPTHRQLRGYLSLVDQHIAQSLAASGGLGLAKRMLEDLAPKESQAQQEKRHEGNSPLSGGTAPPGGDLPVSRAP